MKKLICLIMSLFSMTLNAQDIPEELKNKTINLISHSTPGGQNDIMARIIAKKVEDKTGLKIIVLNKPGASGNIGAKFVKDSIPNGLTLCHCDIQPLVFNELYNIENSIKLGDLDTITIIRETPFSIVVPANSKINNLKDLLDEMKIKELKFSSIGTLTNFVAIELASFVNKDLLIINYKGDPENIIAVAQNLVDFTVVGLTTALSFEQQNKTKIIAVTSEKRLPQLLKYPVTKETIPMSFTSFSGIFVPVGTPEKIKIYLNDVFTKAIKDKEIIEFLEQRGATPLALDIKASTTYYSNMYTSIHNSAKKHKK